MAAVPSQSVRQSRVQTGDTPSTTRKLRAERLRRGWTQADLAALVKIAQSDLSAIENGHRRASVEQKRRLSLVFGRPAPDLFAVDTPAAVTPDGAPAP